MMKIPPLKSYAHLKRRSSLYLWSTRRPLGLQHWLVFSFSMQLDGENGLEHVVETYRHNMEGNVRQLFVNSFSSLGVKYCTLSVKTVSEITLLGRPWHSSPSISAGITEYGKSADDPLSVRLSCAVCTPSPSVYAPLPCSWYGSLFFFNIPYLFCLVWPPRGLKHAGKRTAMIVKVLKYNQALSVMVEFSLHWM